MESVPFTFMIIHIYIYILYIFVCCCFSVDMEPYPFSSIKITHKSLIKFILQIILISILPKCSLTRNTREKLTVSFKYHEISSNNINHPLKQADISWHFLETAWNPFLSHETAILFSSPRRLLRMVSKALAMQRSRDVIRMEAVGQLSWWRLCETCELIYVVLCGMYICNIYIYMYIHTRWAPLDS